MAAQKLTTYSERITRCAFEVGASSFQARVKREDNVHRRLLPEKVSQLNMALAEFKLLASASPLKERYWSLAEKCTRVQEVFESAQLSQDPSFPEMIAHFKQVEPLCNQIALELNEVQKQEQRVLSSAAVSAEMFRSLANAIVIFGVCTNILLATLLSLLFYRSTTKRLYRLMENALRLERHDSLLRPLSGTDEIAQLERTFYSVGTNLQEMERSRQEFIAMVSHDLRSPLTHHCGILRMFKEGFFGDINEVGMNQLLKAERSLKRLIRMINEILDIERLDAGELKLNLSMTDIKELIVESLSQLESVAIDRKIKIEDYSSSIVASVDRDRMVQVLVNLLSNSIKFSSPGARILIGAEDCGDMISINLADNGNGISEEDLPYIFDRFKQADQIENHSKDGYGLGLSICKALIEAHGGTISVESKLQVGTTFTILLPKGS
ncbi:MAG: HAMP domain-containing sensor histidine kinase [Candidatus Obscuribacter sp.]|nr:HAMP domain-containing sensor histidine kinase [Candidatus Obscuribacter sp.]